MLKKITSPAACSALLLLAGATAIPTAIALESNELLFWGAGVFAFGVAFITLLLIFGIWRWKHFARMRAVGKWQLFLLMNAATIALFPAAMLHLRFIGWMYPDRFIHNDALGLALVGAWNMTLFTLVATNIMFLTALPHTTLPATMALRCAKRSKELNTWRIVFSILLVINLIFLAISINIGAVAGVAAAVVYMYVIFALHAGKIAWKEGNR